MSRMILTKFTPPGTVGPDVWIDADDVIMVEQAAPGKNSQKWWRALLHLRGGVTVLVDEEFDSIAKRVASLRSPAGQGSR